jgi:hypothetical protein
MVPTAVLLLVQLPPPVALDCVAVEPTHIAEEPVIDAGLALTVTITVLIHPVPVL